jgi:hypothetical protein
MAAWGLVGFMGIRINTINWAALTPDVSPTATASAADKPILAAPAAPVRFTIMSHDDVAEQEVFSAIRNYRQQLIVELQHKARSTPVYVNRYAKS